MDESGEYPTVTAHIGTYTDDEAGLYSSYSGTQARI